MSLLVHLRTYLATGVTRFICSTGVFFLVDLRDESVNLGAPASCEAKMSTSDRNYRALMCGEGAW